MPVIEEFDIITEKNPLTIPCEDEKPYGSALQLLKVWLKTAITTVALFLFTVTFIIQGFSVYGSCMEPNLRTGERVLGNKFVYRLDSPERGDVVVFRYPQDPRKIFIKRVVGLPGEVLEIQSGQVYINGRLLDEPYVVHESHGSYGPEVIKPGYLFVMGDYRDQSNDSRVWGELPIENIEAKAWVRYWPLGRLEIMR
ncbi:MAG: signal peptidase I [Armatimonadetes bacterium]|nr:signal peptidase I [Armatimonadota bacterium]